jgi:hypothetical protein
MVLGKRASLLSSVGISGVVYSLTPWTRLGSRNDSGDIV